MLLTLDQALKYVLKQDVSQDKQVFGKTDLDDFLSNLKPPEEGEENRVEVEMLQNVLDLSEKILQTAGFCVFALVHQLI